ncbi:MAG: COX15/CtaA family protein [Pseudomonadota bacterium]
MAKRSVFEEVGEKPEVPVAAPGAADAKKARNRRIIGGWLWLLLVLVVVMVAVGGLTRLTDSGLSITEWNVVIGALPPLSDADWNAAFADYQTTDEYKLQNNWMTLADFKPIFWWEWGHRFLGRVIGLVWFVPLVIFAVAGMIPRGWGLRLILPGFLGGLQGAIGWWMVYSGLSDRVDVAAYRLAVHLGIAFLIFAVLCWLILKIRMPEWEALQARRRRVKGLFGWAAAVTGVLFLQILFGALVAGTDAWAGWNTWPLMDGAVIAPEAFDMVPFWANFFENPAMTQFVHRSFAFIVIAAAMVFAFRARRSGHKASGRWATWLLVGMLAQAIYGIFVLLVAAPADALVIAVGHQLGALALLALAMRAKFEVAYPSAQSIRG